MEGIWLYFKIAGRLQSTVLALIGSWCLIVWVRPFLEKRYAAWLCGAAYGAVMMLQILGPFVLTNTLGYGVCVFAAFLVMCAANRNNIGQNFFLAVTFFCLRWQCLQVDTCVGNELYLLYIKIREHIYDPAVGEKSAIVAYTAQLLLGIALSFAVLYGAVRLMLWAYGTSREHMGGRELMLLCVPSVSGAFAYEVIQYYGRIYERDSGKNVYDIYGYHDWLLLLYSLVCFCTILVMTYVFRQWKSEQAENRHREIFSRQMQDLENHIREVERLYRDMRGLRHDMGNHLMTLEQLYGQRKYEAAEQYAEAIRCEMQTPSLGVGSGNPVTDVILSGRKKEMEEKGIAFTSRFQYPSDGQVNAFDISIILNNGLANAIEAVEREGFCGKAQISLTSYRARNMYIIEIANSYAGELKTDAVSGLPVTIKSGEGHGLGLISIRQAARKYLGDIEIGKEASEGEECCVLRVMLQLAGDEGG